MRAKKINAPFQLLSPRAFLVQAGFLKAKDPRQMRAGKEFLQALDSASNPDPGARRDIFNAADKFFDKAQKVIYPLDGQATRFIEISAEMLSRRSQFHQKHFELAKTHLAHAHGMEEKLVSVKLMVKSAHMARNDANPIMVHYGTEAASAALESAAQANDEVVFRKFLDLSFEAVGLISIDGIRYEARKFYAPFGEAAREVIAAGPMDEALKEKYFQSARHYGAFEHA